MEAGVTFKVSDKEAVAVHPGRSGRGAGHFLESLPEYGNEGCVEVLQGSSWKPGEFVPASNGFVNGVICAYNNHHNLIIRPDDVWLAITSQFGLYVNANAESLRHLFVEHEGKKQLVVRQVGTLRSVDYGKLARAMTEQLRENVKDESLCSWVLPDFSTTTINDTLVASVALMATLRSYFSYKFRLCCGIPSVTLLGNVEDWEKINSRVEQLLKFGDECVQWYSLLKKVTSQLVEASKGNADLDFWSRICHSTGGGSGPRYVSGWITVFCTFDGKGKWQGQSCRHGEFLKVDTTDIPPGYLTVDVLVDDNGSEYQTLMFAGHLGWDIADEGKGIAPKLSWAIALKDEAAKEKAKAKAKRR